MLNFNDIFVDDTKYGMKIPKEKYLSVGLYPVIDQGKEQIAGYTDDSEGIYCDVPAIIFGDHTRIIKYIDVPFFLGADGTKLLKIKDNAAFNCKYLYYALSNAKIPNTGYNRHFKWLKELSFDIPSIEKQREIADLIDIIVNLENLRKKQLEKLELFVKSRFVEMFGTFPDNPKGWECCTIRDIVKEVRYGSSRPAVEGGQYPYLRMNNITYEGTLDLSEIKYIDVPEKELEKCTVRKGDVLFNRTNSKELVGKTCLYDRDESMVLAGFIIRVRVNDKVVPEFLVAFLNMDFSKKMLFNKCKAAIGQANINAQELQNIEIYLPHLALQKEFVSLKYQVDKSKLAIQQSLDELETLKKSLMQQYFG